MQPSAKTSPWIYAMLGVSCTALGYTISGISYPNSLPFKNIGYSPGDTWPDWMKWSNWGIGTAKAATHPNSTVMPLPVPSSPTPASDHPMSRSSISEAAARAAPAVVHLVVSNDKQLSSLLQRKYTGSGFIYESSGFILTNAHVVAGVDDAPNNCLMVTLQDGRMFEGRVLAADRASDLAVVKINTDEALPTAKLGSSCGLRAGEWVVALGSPLLLRHSVTAGIISCVERKGAELGLYGACTDYIQTDAAVNQGNSGGPLVNLEGEVVAISSMKAVAADGVSFAIPIDTAKAVVEALHRYGRVPRPFLGITMCDLDAGRTKQLRLKWPSFPDIQQGIAVPQVVSGSPAAKAGLQKGDVIVGWQGDGGVQPTAQKLVETLGRNIGRPVVLSVLRPALLPGSQDTKLSVVVTPVEAEA